MSLMLLQAIPALELPFPPCSTPSLTSMLTLGHYAITPTASTTWETSSRAADVTSYLSRTSTASSISATPPRLDLPRKMTRLSPKCSYFPWLRHIARYWTVGHRVTLSLGVRCCREFMSVSQYTCKGSKATRYRLQPKAPSVSSTMFSMSPTRWLQYGR